MSGKNPGFSAVRVYPKVETKSLMSAPTWLLNHSVAGVRYLLPFGLIWVLVVVEVAINSKRRSRVSTL